MRLSVMAHGAVSVFNTDVLVGVMDLDTIQTNTGTLLFAATRGDGWLSVFDLGASGGDTQQIDGWSIASTFLQLQSTDIEIRQVSGGGYDLFLAGLNDAALQSVGVTLGQGPDTFGPASGWSTDGFDAGDITEMALWDGGSGGLVAVRGGGLEHLTFATDGDLHRQTISQGVDMDGRSATDIVTATQNGTEVAFVSYGSANVVSLFRMADDDTMQHVADVGADDGLWAERPGAMAAVTGPDGELYIVVTASLSGSLSVLSVDAGADGLRVVDHVLDTRDTRFEDASYVSALTIGGQDYIVAAGTDSGLSLFVMLGGGRLQHVGTVAGSIGSPLHGISNIEAVDTDTGARIFVTTQGAPFLVEYSVALDAQGVTQMAGQNGGTLIGTSGDDILNGSSGQDILYGGDGNDILMDGAGRDSLRGDLGADLFVLTPDDATDVILDYQPGMDRIDVSALGVIGGWDSLVITTQSWGAELRFGTSITEVRSANGAALSASDFGGDAIIIGNRPSVDPLDYDVPTPAPTQTPGPEPVAPAWWAEAVFTHPDPSGSVQGGSTGDVLTGTRGDDVMFGNAGEDLIQGGAGDDLVFGGVGFDTIEGQDGADTLIGEGNADSLFGGNGNDVLIGGAGFDQLYGGNGDDSLWSGDTADRLYGGAGNDWISAGTNVGMTVDGLWGEQGNDTLFGNAGFDLLDGGDGNDVLDGGDQADNLYGRMGADTLFGGQGLDRLFGGDGNDQLVGGAGNDGHFGEQGDDTAWGGTGNDRFFGGTGNDILSGQDGQDSLYGGAGFDTLIGGAGDDLLIGNFNADRFVFETGHGHDTIGDFDAINGFELLDFANLSAFNAPNSVLAAAEQIGNDVLIATGGDSSIRLLDVMLVDLGADDFVF